MTKNSKIIISIIVALVAMGGLWFILSSGEDPLASNKQSSATSSLSSQETTSKVADNEHSETNGEYVDYSAEKLASTEGNKVLFFHAKWCPTCKSLDQNIRAGVVPSGLTIFKVDYDTQTELVKKYGVTYQHTLVQVDDTGELLHKWAGSYTIQQIVDELI